MNSQYCEVSTLNAEGIALNMSATGALERLFELAVVLAEAMDRGLAERGLTRARAEVLWRLGRNGSADAARAQPGAAVHPT